MKYIIFKHNLESGRIAVVIILCNISHAFSEPIIQVKICDNDRDFGVVLRNIVLKAVDITIVCTHQNHIIRDLISIYKKRSKNKTFIIRKYDDGRIEELPQMQEG